MYHILNELRPFLGCRSEMLKALVTYLHRHRIPYEVQRFKGGGTNLLIHRSSQNRVILSAHYDGEDLNDNLCSVAVLLEMAKRGSRGETLILLTDLEEEGGLGMEAFVQEYGKNLPMVVLELVGCGRFMLLGTSAFGFLTSSGNLAQHVEIPMDNALVAALERCAHELQIPYQKHAVPAGDHLVYAALGGRCALVSMTHPVDLVVMERMRRLTPTHQLFEGLNRAESTIAGIPPYGRTGPNQIMEENLKRTHRLLCRFLDQKPWEGGGFG